MGIFNEQVVEMLIKGTGDTVYMVTLSVFFSYLIGLPLGVLVFVTADGGIKPIKSANKTLEILINIGRSIPFIIMMVALFPFTRLLVGQIIGPTSAVVPLVVSTMFFVARMVETSLKEINIGVIEASKTMGATNFQIITKVLIPETIPSLIRGVSITTITLISYSAMAGAIGAGGLGDIAIRYGYHRRETEIMFATIIILVVLVQVIQVLMNVLAVKIDKNK